MSASLIRAALQGQAAIGPEGVGASFENYIQSFKTDAQRQAFHLNVDESRSLVPVRAREIVIRRQVNFATDSAEILPDSIPGKGEILTQLSNFWFAKTADWMPNHLSSRSLLEALPRGTPVVEYERRSVVAKRLRPLPVEAIARGYIIGSGWKDYQLSLIHI